MKIPVTLPIAAITLMPEEKPAAVAAAPSVQVTCQTCGHGFLVPSNVANPLPGVPLIDATDRSCPSCKAPFWDE
jgi:hypothetical protein